MRFFKSTWFKCVTILLAISLIAGGLLSVLNDILYVSPEERTGRALTKIYNRSLASSEYEIVLDADNEDSPVVCKKGDETFGEIQKIFLVGKDNESDTEYDMLFKAQGNEGYKNGTVTAWIKVEFNSDSKKITKVIIESYEKQTLMSKLDDKYLKGFLIDISDEYQTYFSSNKKTGNNPVSGATKSAQAGCNSVNCVLNYLEEKGL